MTSFFTPSTRNEQSSLAQHSTRSPPFAVGSVAAIDLAAHLSQVARPRNGLAGGGTSDQEGPAGIVLHSALASGLRVACKTERTWCCDPFPKCAPPRTVKSYQFPSSTQAPFFLRSPCSWLQLVN